MSDDDEYYEERPVTLPRPGGLGRPAAPAPAAPAKKLAAKKVAAPKAAGLGRPAMPGPKAAVAKKAAPKKLGAPASGAAQEEAKSLASKIRSGWGAAQQVMDSASTYAQSFNPDKGTGYLIKFLEDGPYASYARHWVKRTSPTGGTSNRPYTCLESVGKTCPLCEVGDKPQAVSAFNIVIVDDDGTLTHKTWDVGPALFNTLKGFGQDAKNGPLSKRYYYVMKSAGKGGSARTTPTPVPASILQDEYGVEPPTAEALARVDLYDPTILEIPKASDLREIAAELVADDGDDGDAPTYDED